VATLFISDLHLAAGEAKLAEYFTTFLEGPARKAQALYVLGDLFDAWVGDDDLADPFVQTVVSALRALSDTGVAIYLQHGNRDFLLGEKFAGACGARLLPEVAIVKVEDQALLLMHGDQLCTDDAAYLAWRRQARDPAWQAQFLELPLDQRRSMAAGLRAQSEAAKAGKAPEIMDVNAQAVVSAFAASACRILIHGHTHRPARHTVYAEGQSRERWVLPDWRPEGGYLELAPQGLALRSWPQV
jgi:UDP-2,3-diacylglucosamine hydrolase